MFGTNTNSALLRLFEEAVPHLGLEHLPVLVQLGLLRCGFWFATHLLVKKRVLPLAINDINEEGKKEDSRQTREKKKVNGTPTLNNDLTQK